MRQTFATLVVLAAYASADAAFPAPLPADCAALSADVFNQITVADCEANPEFAINQWSFLQQMEELNTELIPVTSGDYTLNMIRVKSDAFAQEVGNDSTPVLLMHCNFADAWQWSPNTVPMVVRKLFDAGFDVYIGNRRGTPLSSANDNGLTEEDFWNFDMTNIGEEDVPAMVAAIQAKRLADGRDCKKVSLVGRAFGAQETTIALAAYPTSTAAWISQAVTVAPCWIPQKKIVKGFSGIDVDPMDDPMEGGRMLKHKSNKYKTKWSYSHNGHSHSHAHSPHTHCEFDSAAYYEEFGNIRSALTYDEYKTFYSIFSHWKKSVGYYKWKCDGLWMTGLQEAVCEVKPDYDMCRPDYIVDLEALIDGVSDLGVYSFFGENWDDEKQLICDEGANGDLVLQSLCDNIFLTQEYPFGPQTLGANVWYQNAQQAISQNFVMSDPEFFQTGWAGEPMAYDLSGISVPMRNIYIRDDNVCNETVNQQFATDNFGDKVDFSVLFTNDYTTPNDLKGADNSAAFGAVLLASLAGNKGADIEDGICADGTFDLANWN